jgi:hypothetical protein
MSSRTLLEQIRHELDVWERQLQIVFPAKVVEVDTVTSTVTVVPAHWEIWRNEDGEKVVDSAVGEEAGVERLYDIPVAFFSSAGISLTTPVAAGDFGICVCAKYSLEMLRSTEEVGDPLHMHRFTPSGAVFLPVYLATDASPVSHNASLVSVHETEANADYLALKSDVQDIKTMLDGLKSDYNTHKHTGVTAGGGSSGVTDTLNTDSYTVQGTTKFQAE